MNNDHAKVHQLGLREMNKMPVGTRVRCTMAGGKLVGTVVDTEPPMGLLSPRFKVRWDSGETSHWMRSSTLRKI